MIVFFLNLLIISHAFLLIKTHFRLDYKKISISYFIYIYDFYQCSKPQRSWKELKLNKKFRTKIFPFSISHFQDNPISVNASNHLIESQSFFVATIQKKNIFFIINKTLRSSFFEQLWLTCFFVKLNKCIFQSISFKY